MKFVLQVFQEVQHLGLDGDIESGNRLIGDDELGVQGQGPRDPDALPLAAAEFMGVAVDMLGPQADHFHQLQNSLLALLSGSRCCE